MMSVQWWLVLVCLLLQAATAAAATEVAPKVLRVYGPGGPQHVLQECATLFEEHGWD